MHFYAQLNEADQVVAVTEAHSELDPAPHLVLIESLDQTLLNCVYDRATGTFMPPTVLVVQHATKRAFQNRFPKAANGISTKWDAMCLFLVDDGYAASLGVTGAPLYELRMLITTGVQRLNASPFVDMGPDGEATAMTGLLINPAIPAAFRLTAADRQTMMETPLADDERYKG